MRLCKDFEYINWIWTFERHNISFKYDIMSNGFRIYECNGVKFKWKHQSIAYKYARDLCSKLEEGNYETWLTSTITDDE